MQHDPATTAPTEPTSEPSDDMSGSEPGTTRTEAFKKFAQRRGLTVVAPPRTTPKDSEPAAEPAPSPSSDEPPADTPPAADASEPAATTAPDRPPADSPAAIDPAAGDSGEETGGGEAGGDSGAEQASDSSDDADEQHEKKFGTRRFGQRAVDTTLTVALAKKVKDTARTQNRSRGEILIDAIRAHHATIARISDETEPLYDDSDPFAGLAPQRTRARVADNGVSVKLQFYVPPAFADRIAILAETARLTPSAYMRAALEEWAKPAVREHAGA